MREIKRPAHSSSLNAPMAVLDRIYEIHSEVERYMLDQHEPTIPGKPRPCPLNCGRNLPRSVIIQLSL